MDGGGGENWRYEGVTITAVPWCSWRWCSRCHCHPRAASESLGSCRLDMYKTSHFIMHSNCMDEISEEDKIQTHTGIKITIFWRKSRSVETETALYEPFNWVRKDRYAVSMLISDPMKMKIDIHIVIVKGQLKLAHFECVFHLSRVDLISLAWLCQ